ncbi:MAG: HAMP domain-containing protein, partial [Spirochaetota bacterium]
MKISRLYIKYFAVVMAIVILSQILNLGLFRVVSSRSARLDMNNYLSGMVYIVREAVSDKLLYETPAPDGTYPRLGEFLQKISISYNSQIWVIGHDGKMLASTGKDHLPAFSRTMEHSRDFSFDAPPDRKSPAYIVIPVDTPKVSCSIHIIHHRPGGFRHDERFIAGLVIISAFVAMILFPLTRRITIPLRRLTESADAIACGEFDRRVDESSGDEIGELARAFNAMSDKLLLMIRGTKELTANVSHQIRSPLARMTVASEILRERLSRGDAAGAQGTLNTIENEIGEIDRLTGRIIEMIRTDIAHRADDYCKIDPVKIAH